jgi:hypothetical protein
MSGGPSTDAAPSVWWTSVIPRVDTLEQSSGSCSNHAGLPLRRFRGGSWAMAANILSRCRPMFLLDRQAPYPGLPRGFELSLWRTLQMLQSHARVGSSSTTDRCRAKDQAAIERGADWPSRSAVTDCLRLSHQAQGKRLCGSALHRARIYRWLLRRTVSWCVTRPRGSTTAFRALAHTPHSPATSWREARVPQRELAMDLHTARHLATLGSRLGRMSSVEWQGTHERITTAIRPVIPASSERSVRIEAGPGSQAGPEAGSVRSEAGRLPSTMSCRRRLSAEEAAVSLPAGLRAAGLV